MSYLLIVLATALLATDVELVTARAVNISNVWLLPEEGFPVFYRYFRDRITWFEADAVCQFHHAQLVTEIGDVQRAEAFSNNCTVDSSDQFDATRAYLKELDVVNHVWVGLKRSGTEGEFTWTDYKPLENGGYWQEQIPMTDNSVCAALDPAADFRWHPLKCGGPEVASFICQLEVPAWARKEDGCMLTSLPSLTVTYLPEQGAVELISDCGLEGTRRIACKGQANREEMMKQLSCETSTESQTEATSSWDNELPTRHRRDTDVTVDMASVQHILHTTEGLTEVNIVEITDQPPSAELKENLPSTTGDPETSSMQVLPQEMSVAEEPIKTSPGVLSDDLPFQHSLKVVATETVKTKNPERPSPVMFPISGGFAGFAADDSLEKTSNRRVVPVASKPIPPSLKGNSPFIEPVITLNKTDNSEENGDNTTPKPVEDESHELFTGSKGSSDNIPQQEKHDAKAVNFPPLSVYTINKDHDIDESSVRGSSSSSSPVQRDVEISTTAFPPATIKKSEEVNNSKDDLKFFTRVIAYDNTKGFSTPSSLVSESKTTNKNDDFLFVVTESPDKSSSKLSSILRTTIHSRDFSTTKPETTDTLKTEIRSEETLTDKEMGDEAEPEIPERPNRGRLLIRPQHHSFYPYFLNRVLG